jgi:lipopolysaccharide biosynthesis glycosyltransferase
MPSAPGVRATRDDLALVFATDGGFARATAVAMHSALSRLSPKLDVGIYVLHNGLADESQRRLRRVAQAAAGSDIRWIEVPRERLPEARYGSHITSTAFARLLAPELLPASVRRIVYLDGDVLVKGDLTPLFLMALDGAPFAAARDMAVLSTSHELSGVRDQVEPRPYFNSGVLVIDATGWRAAGIADRSLAFASGTGAPLRSADQDAMNAVADRWCELEPGWNVQLEALPGGIRAGIARLPVIRDVLAPARAWRHGIGDAIDRPERLFRDGAILHFVGPLKPWDPTCTSPGTLLWTRALILSGWYTPRESLRWVLPWLGKRFVNAGRRTMAALRRGVRQLRRPGGA